MSIFRRVGPRRSHLWWVYASLRTLYCWVTLAITTIILAAMYLPLVKISPESRLIRWLERLWMSFIVYGSNVKLKPRGMDNVEAGRSYIVMANHRSMYDIPALHYLLGNDRDLRWVGKHELLKVPAFGWALGASRHVAIDRQNRERGITALREAARASREGVSFAILPEGTRNAEGTLLPFKKGGFHLAIDTNLPILPVSIVGSEKMMIKGTWWILAGTIEVTVHPAIPTEGLNKDELESLIERTRASIRAGLTDQPEEDVERSTT